MGTVDWRTGDCYRRVRFFLDGGSWRSWLRGALMQMYFASGTSAAPLCRLVPYRLMLIHRRHVMFLSPIFLPDLSDQITLTFLRSRLYRLPRLRAQDAE